jgi:hypothetical protein
VTEEELLDRSKRLLQRYDDMRIVGGGGEWSGNARQGFAFNPKPIGGGGLTHSPCPDFFTNTVTATLSGISLNCGCILIYDAPYPAEPPPPDPLDNWLWSDPHGINTDYTLTRDFFDSTHFFLNSAGLIHIKTWGIITEPNCPNDPPDTEGDATFHIHAYCVDGIWTVFVTFGASPISLFMYGSGATGDTISNAVPHCGFPEFLLNMGVSPERFFGANTDGSVVISF